MSDFEHAEGGEHAGDGQFGADDDRVDEGGFGFNRVEHAAFLVIQPQFSRVADDSAVVASHGVDQGSEFFQDIFHGLDEFGSVADQAVAAVGGAAVGGAGHGEHLASLVCGVGRGDECAAARGGFDDNQSEAESGDESVALGEGPAHRLLEGREFADDRARLRDGVGQSAMLGRVEVEDSASEHGDRASRGVQRAAVGGGVDAPRQAADDRQAGAGEPGCQPFRLANSVMGGMTRTNDGDGQFVLGLGIPAQNRTPGGSGISRSKRG